MVEEARPASAAMKLRRAVARRGTPVMVAALGAQNVFRVVSNLVLTRLLAPEAFGVVGVVTAISYVLQLLTDLGLHAFIVRSKDADDKRFLGVVWTIRLARSVLLTVLMFLGAGALSALFQKPELEAPIRAASFLFILEGLKALYPIAAERARRVAYVSVVELGGFLVQMIATIAAAFVMRSYWGLIVGMYAGAAASLILSYAAFRGGSHPIAFDRAIARDLWAFARVVIPSNLIAIVISLADKVVVGRTLALDALGLYMLAVSLTAAGRQLVTTWANRVLFPVYAQGFRDAPQDLLRVYNDQRRRLTRLLAVLFGAGAGGGTLVCRTLFDDRYLGAGPFVSLLCLLPLFALTALAAEVLVVATGRLRPSLEANFVRLGFLALAAPVGWSAYGVIGLVAAFALVEAAAALYWLWRLHTLSLLNIGEELAFLAAAAGGAGAGVAADRLAAHLIGTGAIPAF